MEQLAGGMARIRGGAGEMGVRDIVRTIAEAMGHEFARQREFSRTEGGTPFEYRREKRQGPGRPEKPGGKGKDKRDGIFIDLRKK